MQLTKTIILKLDAPDNYLGELLSVFSQGMNYASQIVSSNGKPMGSDRIQKATYRHLRNELNLKSQMCCNIARQVAGAYKTLQEQVAIGQTEWQTLDFDPTSATFSFERDFVFNKDTLSITTLEGRRKYKLQNYRYAQKYIDGSWRYLASKLCLHRDGSYYFHLSCNKEMPDKKLTEASTFMGIDVGINCPRCDQIEDSNALALLTHSINAAYSLFDAHRIPREIIIHNAIAELVVQAFTANFGKQQNVQSIILFSWKSKTIPKFDAVFIRRPAMNHPHAETIRSQMLIEVAKGVSKAAEKHHLVVRQTLLFPDNFAEGIKLRICRIKVSCFLQDHADS